MDRRTDMLKRQLVRWKSWKQIEKYPHIFGKTCNISFRCLLYINFKRDFVYLFLFSWRLYIFLHSFISMLTTTEIVSLANLYRSGSCFSLHVLILSLLLLSFTRAWILGIHRLRFFAYSHSRADCMYRIKLFWWRPPYSFVYSKTLLIDLNLGFVKNILDADSFRVLKGYTYVRLTVCPFVFLTLRRCRYMEGKLSLSLTQFVTTTPRRISNVCKSGICRLSSCNCVPGPVEPSILPSNRDNFLCQKNSKQFKIVGTAFKKNAHFPVFITRQQMSHSCLHARLFKFFFLRFI